MKFVDVIVPLPLRGTFTYEVPAEWADNVRVGMRVVVPFGKKKLYTAIVCLIHTHKPELYDTKEIICLLDTQPVLRRPQLKFWEWISAYYQSAMGDVYQAAVPSGLKLESETKVQIQPDFEAEHPLASREQQILDILSGGKIFTISELNKQMGVRDVMPALKTLLEKDAVAISEELAHRYRPKMETYVRLTAGASEEDHLRKIFDELSRARKQLELLMSFIDLSKCLTNKPKEISRKELLEKTATSAAVLNGLVERSVLELYQVETGRLSTRNIAVSEMSQLNSFQQQALHEIEALFKEKNTVLLHGVTSSGKTELYIHLINKVLSEGKQVLYLVPEIALTTQLTSRLQRVFGNRLGVYHSRFSDAERVEIWNNVLNDKGYDVIIGVRSSIFLPFRQLGLVIVDEEHETSYKQFDPAPRYHARNAATVLASMHGAKTLLGSATPSIETYFNARAGKYGLVELTRRHEDMELPSVLVVDTKEAYRKKMMNGHFSDTLKDKIDEALRNKEQVILFQNRRGYAPYIECKGCAYVPKCKNCDVSLTVHKALNVLTCHYCGYTEAIPQVCPVCKTPGLNTKGFGTEQIEDEIKSIFPEAKVQRMDMDTTRSKKSYGKIISEFEEGKVDILVGTQMVTKGLDFERVSLVGILNADNLLNFPDFRANERAFQLMAQVSGRAGRKNKQGLVVLQTTQPDHKIIDEVIRNDYAGMFIDECAERNQFRYPPFYRMILVVVRHREAAVLNRASHQLVTDLKSVFGSRVLGPIAPAVGRIQNLYLKQIILKIENGASPERAKELLQAVADKLLSQQDFRSVTLSVDVDPM